MLDKKLQKILQRICFVFSLGCVPVLLAAEENHTIQSPNYSYPVTAASSTITENTALLNQAQSWGLTLAEYRHYQWLMTHTPSGRWYQTLDPPEVLALNATDDKQLHQYTEMVVRNTHARLEHELHFNRVFGEVFHELYPNENPIDVNPSSGPAIDSVWGPGDRLWLLVDIHASSAVLVKTLLAFVGKYPGVMLDIYIVGNAIKTADIEQWAERNHIPVTAVNHTLTLNFGHDRFAALQKQQTIQLPYVARLHQGHLQPIALSDFL